MKICGIITEYNPFHLGHAYQISETKRQLNADYVVVIMSGHFVQRGEPAIFDKWTRSRLALAGGADIVIQLPTLYATSSAEFFSKGAIELLNSLGIIDILSFGSESGDLQSLMSIADFLIKEPPNFKNALRGELKKGYSYPKARHHALLATYKQSENLLKGSNNILGIEYLKSLKRQSSSITPYTVKRIGSDYLNQTIHGSISSATAIRKLFKDFTNTKDILPILRSVIPDSVYRELMTSDRLNPIFIDDMFSIVKYLLETQSVTDIYDFPDELYNRMLNQMYASLSYESFIDAVLSKNYTKTTIQRSLMHLFLNIHHSDMQQLMDHGLPYIHILGFNQKSSAVMSQIKRHASLPMITNVKDHQKYLSSYGKKLLKNEIRYSNLYNQLIANKYLTYKKNDYRQPIIVR